MSISKWTLRNENYDLSETEASALTADCNLLPPLHGSAVAVVGVAGDVIHVSGDVVYDGHHVSGDFLAHQSTRDVERDRGHGCAHGYAQDRHAAALHNQVDGVNRRGLIQIRQEYCIKTTHLNEKKLTPCNTKLLTDQ